MGRPLLGDAPRRLVAVRIDPTVIAGLKAEAKRLGIGYHTLINRILARAVYKARRRFLARRRVQHELVNLLGGPR